MRNKLFPFLAAIAVAHTAFAQADYAATVQLYITTVNATPTGGTWQVYADDSDNNDGLAFWDIDILGNGGAVVNAPATLKAPRPNDISGQYADGTGGPMGFNTAISRGTNSGTNLVEIGADQNFVFGPSDDPTYDMGILVGVGQEPSSASPQNGTQGPTDGSGTPTGISTPVWNYTPLATVSGGVGAPSYQIAGTLIEQGTYTTSAGCGSLIVQPDIYVYTNPGEVGSVTTDAQVLGTSDSGMNEPFGYFNFPSNRPLATTLPDTISLSIPEPTSLGIVGFGAGIITIFGRCSRQRRNPKQENTR
jgi:hypothetical protein